MTALLSTGTADAGKFENAPTGVSGEQVLPLPNIPVTVYQSDGVTLATLYTTQAKTATAANPVNTDSYGNLTFYTDPGIYVLSFLVQGIPVTQTIEVEPSYTDASWNVYAATAAVAALSGDSVLANASSAAFAVTTPAPVLGARLLVTKTDSSANAVSVTTPTGVIDGPAGITGIGTATIQISTEGQSFELHCDGTNWHVVGGGGGGGGGEATYQSRAAITTANTYQNGATYTPSVAGRYLCLVTFLVPSGGAAVAAQVTYTMAGNAQTATIYPTGQGNLPQGAFSPVPLFIDSDAAAITIQVQSSSTSTVVTSAITKG